jgi:hypothetical protein
MVDVTFLFHIRFNLLSYFDKFDTSVGSVTLDDLLLWSAVEWKTKYAHVDPLVMVSLNYFEIIELIWYKNCSYSRNIPVNQALLSKDYIKRYSCLCA